MKIGTIAKVAQMATSAKFGQFLKSLKVGESTAMLKFEPVHRETAVLAAGFERIIEMAFSETEGGDFMGMGVSTAFIIKAFMDSNKELLELFFRGLDEDDERRETIVKTFVDLVVAMGFMVIDERALAAELEGNDGQADDAEPAEPSNDGRPAQLPAPNPDLDPIQLDECRPTSKAGVLAARRTRTPAIKRNPELDEHDTGELEEGMTSGERAEYYRMKAGDIPSPQDPADIGERERTEDDDDEQADGQPAIGRPGSDNGSTGPGENDADEVSSVDH